MRARLARKPNLLLSKSHFTYILKLIAFASFLSRIGQLKFCLRIQLNDERNLFKPKQRLYHIIWVYFSPKCKVKNKNNQKETNLVAVICAQAGSLHKQLLLMRRKL